jgi:chorismate mutase
MGDESKRYHQIRREILRKLLVRITAMRTVAKAKTEASSTLATKSGKT